MRGIWQFYCEVRKYRRKGAKLLIGQSGQTRVAIGNMRVSNLALDLDRLLRLSVPPICKVNHHLQPERFAAMEQ
jgi:hypothetical protein